MDEWLMKCLNDIEDKSVDLFFSIAPLDSDIADNPNFEDCRTAYNNLNFWPHPDYDWQTIKDYNDMGCWKNNIHLDGNDNAASVSAVFL